MFAVFTRVLVDWGVSRVSRLVMRRRGQWWWWEIVILVSRFEGADHIWTVSVVQGVRVWVVPCSRRRITMVFSEIVWRAVVGSEVVIIALVIQI
jgi:hypothetical protein